jgi:DNA ligase-associated metallophosphoesterase
MSAAGIQFHGHAFELLADRAVWWPFRRTLVIADLHLGKAATFRARGLPVPAGTTARDLSRLSRLIETFDPRRLLILGDLIHARESAESLHTFRAWRDRHPRTEVAVVLGNHDRHVSQELIAAAVDLYAAPVCEDGVFFTHEPADSPTCPTVAGHLHPMARLTDFDGSGVNVPCFVLDPDQLTLPAFGQFTGGCRIDPMPNRCLYTAAAGRVVCIGLPA